MADIEIIIKIPENTYRRIQALVRDDYFEHDICGYSMQRIADGTPLPKGHGDLIDRKELKKEVYTTTEWNGDVHKIVYEASVDDANAIIKAEDEDEKEQNTEPELEE